MTEWLAIATDVGVGAGGGFLSKTLEDYDVKRIAANPKLSQFAQMGNYLDYGVPIAGIMLSALGMVKGPWQDRLVTMGATLAGRRATGQIKTAMNINKISAWYPMYNAPTHSAPMMPSGVRGWRPSIITTS